MYKKYIFLILTLFLIYANNTIAGEGYFRTHYDKEKDLFVFEWWNEGYGVDMSTIFDPRNKVKPEVNASIKLIDKTYLYNYKIYNGKEAQSLLQDIFIQHTTEVYDSLKPSNDWSDGEYNNTGFWNWAKTMGDMDKRGIAPGSSQSGFSFKSKGIPTIVKSSFVSRPSSNFGGPGESSSLEVSKAFDEAWLKYKEQYPEKFGGVKLKTVGPTAPPEELNATDFMQSIIDMKHEAQDLGWIKEEGGKGIIGGLDKKLDNALKAIKSGDTSSAKNILEAFIKQVEAQGCATYDDCQPGKHLMPEAYALLKYNAQYLIDNM